MMTRQGCLMLVLALGLVLSAVPAAAHCDALDGPVVTDARAALAQGTVTPVLKWVRPADEPAVTTAFTQTLAVRKLSPEANTLADTYFFETVVRLHRASEGAPYTGLKPAGAIDPTVAAADAAIATGSADKLIEMLTSHLTRGVRERLAHVRTAEAQANTSVAAGRAYVAAYVDYVHYIEALHQAVMGADHHAAEAPAPATQACGACRE